jgi:hypothetical protein
MQLRIVSQKLQDNADICYKEVNRLISIFNRIRPGQEFKDMRANLELAHNIAGNKIVTECVAEYMIPFKQDIIDGNVEKIYNFNYETLIVKGTRSTTQQLILTLINSMRSIWDISSDDNKLRIKNSIQKLLLYCITHEKLYAQLQHT